MKQLLMTLILFGGLATLTACNKSSRSGSTPSATSLPGGTTGTNALGGLQGNQNVQVALSTDVLQNTGPGLKGETDWSTVHLWGTCQEEETEGGDRFYCLLDEAKELMETVPHNKVVTVYNCDGTGFGDLSVDVTLIEYQYTNPAKPKPAKALACELTLNTWTYTEYTFAASYSSVDFCSKNNYSSGRIDSLEEALQHYSNPSEDYHCQMKSRQTIGGEYEAN